MISANVSGTETVTLYEDADGGAVGWNTTSFKAVDITVNNADFLNGGTWGGVNGQPGQAVWNNEQVIWPQVLENAFAQLSGGYSGIEYGGSPMLALETLTGRAATYNSPSQITSATLSTDGSADDLMVFDTPDDDNSTYNLVGSHAYMFDGLSTAGGVTYADLLNPWGFDEPDAVPVSALAAAFVEIDIGQYGTPANAPSITGTVASVATTDKASVVPFPGVTVASAADAAETVTVKLSARANGTLSDAGGGTVTAFTGTYTIAGTAAAVTRALWPRRSGQRAARVLFSPASAPATRSISETCPQPASP